MAENPTASPPQQQQQLLNGGVDPIGTPSLSTSQNPNAPTNSNNLTSIPIPPSPSHSQISSPRLPPHSQSPHQNQIPQIQSQTQSQSQSQLQQQHLQQLQQFRQQQQSMIQQQGMSQRSGSVSRLREIHQQFGAVAAASAMRQHAGMYGGQMNFSAASSMQQQQQQQVQQQVQQQQISGGVMSQVGIMGQGNIGQIPMLAGQTAPATQINLQNQMLGQQRQRMGLAQGSQFHPANGSGQSLQGMQAIGMTGSHALNSQIRGNGTSSYTTQRISHGQVRQQQLSQSLVTSNQKVPNQDMTRTSSLTSMNSQLSGLTQNGQTTMMQNPVTQQQWLKQNPLSMAVQGPSYQLQQQQAFLHQQLRNLPLNQQQISQLIQQQPQLSSQQQQHLQGQQTSSVQQLQLQQQLPRIPGPVSQKPMSLTAVPNAPGGSSFQGAEMGGQLLGKRKIQDLVSQVDPKVKLDPALEDVLLEMADDFIDSVTTFACSLAKHRKSSILEPKDLLLHLEKNWHLKIPGLQREEQRNQKTTSSTDAHKRRIEMIRSQVESQSELDSNIAKGAVGQVGSDATLNRIIRSSATSSEQLILPGTATNMLQKVPRF